tara:strand:+ start:232 stop:504 length:273 start_codon:yes stop_codon:yes gene_type:complete
MELEDYFRIYGVYELKDGLYNVKGSVRLKKQVEKLPFKFGKVTGDFSCSHNRLTSLKGSPNYIGSDFDCDKILHNNKEYRKYLIMKKLRE